MKVIQKRVNETRFSCVLDLKTMQAVLSEAAAKDAGVDLKADNVRVLRFGVQGGVSSNHPTETHVELVVTHSKEVESGTGFMIPPPPTAPPMRTYKSPRCYVCWVATAIIYGVAAAMVGVAVMK